MAGFFGAALNWCSLQTCDANLLSRSASKFSFMASKESSIGGPIALKTHAHREQPQPRNSGWSTHTSSRITGRIMPEVFAGVQDYYLRLGWVGYREEMAHPKRAAPLLRANDSGDHLVPHSSLEGRLQQR